MSEWVNVTAKMTEDEKKTLEDYMNRYNSLRGTSFTLSSFVRFLIGKNAEIFNKNHPI
jgi:hypothetical protein